MCALNETLSDWLWGRLHERDWTRADLARAVPIDPSQVTRWLKGVDKPSRASAIRLAEIFSTHPSYVLALADLEPMLELDIDLSDPLISFAAMHQHRLSRRQKEAMIEFMQSMIEEEP